MDEMLTLRQDLRFAARILLKQRTATIVAVTTLALGIGANTAIFAVVNAVLLRPLPYKDSGSLVLVWGNFFKMGLERLGAKPAEFIDYREQNKSFDQIAAFNNADVNLTGNGEPDRISAAYVTADLFPLLGVNPATGAVFTVDQNQPGRDDVVILSHGLWARRFGSDRNLLGQRVMLDGRNRTVVGIMPAGFQFPHSSFRFAEPADIWLPLVFTPEQITQRQGRYNLNVLARLKNGVTLEQARSDMESLGGRLEQQHSGYRGPNGEDGGWRVTVEQLKEQVVGSSRRPLLLLLGVVGLVLLIACANVVSLSLARSAGRRQEIAVRSAIGASRRRLVAQSMTESLLLALIGGFAGLLLAIWGTELLVALGPSNIPRVSEISVDNRVLLFTMVVTLLTTILSGLIPALRLSKPDLVEAMKETRPGTTSRKGHRLGSLIVSAEIAVAVLVIVSAGLMIRSFWQLLQVEPGFNVDNLLAVELSLPQSKYPDGHPVAGFYSKLSEKINAMPGVESVGMAALIPLGGAAIDDPFSIEGRPLDPSNLTTAGHQTISPNLFHTLGVRFAAGRDFTEWDASGASEVAIINRQMAKTYWPNEDPIGRRIKLGAPRATRPWLTVVGIVEDLPHRGLDSKPRPDWFMPHAQSPARDMVLIVRSKTPAETLTADIKVRLSELDPDQPITRAETINQVISDSVSDRRFSVELLTLFAAVALVLASVGAYGLVSFSVAQRTQELSVRLALGAQSSDIVGLVMKQGAVIIAVGLIAGLIAAFAVTRVISSLLFNVSTTDPATFIAASMILGGLSLLACYIPARRASRPDAIRVLR